MTSHDRSRTIRLEPFGDLIAAVPALLGFPPTRSLVLLAHDVVTGRIGATARIDLGLTKARGLRADCRRDVAAAVGLLRNQDTDAVICLAVDDRDLTRAMPALTRALDSALRSPWPGEPDIELIDLLFVDEIGDGARWLCRHGESGRVADPQSSPVALAAAFDGRPVRASRDELLALLAPEAGVVTTDACRVAVAQAHGDSAELLSALIASVTRAEGPAALPDEEVALLGGALLDVHVRDAAMGLALTVVADEARRLFESVARRLDGTPRAAAATLVAASAYLRGDGPLTGIALAAALEADGGYRAAHLLASAFDCGMAPADIACLAETGLEVAHRLGVALPPRDAEYPAAG